MTLSSNITTFAGNDQASVASLTADGNFYRCYVFLNRTRSTIDACVVRVLPTGKSVVVFRNIVAEATDQEIDDTEGMPLDCPKVIAVGTTFVVHWLQASEVILAGELTIRDWSLYRATMDMTSFSITTWNNRGAVGLLQTHALYDVKAVIGSDTDFVVARYTSGPEITVQLFTDFDWIDFDWTSVPAVTIDPRVLGVYAHRSDGDVLVAYQLTSDGQLYCLPIAIADGTDGTPVQTFTQFPAADYVQVGFARSGTAEVALVAEARTDAQATIGADTDFLPHLWIHAVVYRRVNTATAARVSNEHWIYNVSMGSAPWSYANGSSLAGTTLDLYCLLTYKSIVMPHDWQQAYAFVCNFDLALWGQEASGSTVRPRPVMTAYTNGVPDARAAGWFPEFGDVHNGGPARRMNHLSEASGAPPFGPDVKTRTVATVVFAGYGTVRAQNLAGQDIPTLQPERAEVRGLVCSMEDPWSVYRDLDGPEQPVDNFYSSYARAMFQATEVGNALFISGGTPHLYDGTATVECGFPWKPEIFLHQQYDDGDDFGLDLESADMEVGGTYYAYAVYAWPDAQGQIHRSGPSNIYSHELTSTATGIAWRVRTVTNSLKDSTVHYPDSQAIQVELYRTTDAGTIFYRVFGADDRPASGHSWRPKDTPSNDPTVGYIDIYDGLSDAELQLQGAGPYQFDENNVLVGPLPQTVPGMTCVTTHQNRLFGVDMVDQASIWYSDEILPDYGGDYYQAPIFNDEMTFRIGEVGDITAMQSMNNALIVFTRDKIYSLTVRDAGSGLLDIGAEILHEGTGCIEPRSVLLGPKGIYFQSSKGYYLLSRDRQVGYADAGAGIEDDLREAGNVRSAALLEDRHQIRLACNGRPVVTQTWTMTVGGAGEAGTWTIDGLGVDVEYEGSSDDTGGEIAIGLAARIDELLAAAPPDQTLRYTVEDVSAAGSTVIIELVANATATLTGTGAGAGTVTGSLSESIQTQPRVMIGDFLYEPIKWSRADLVQTSATTRMSELVSGCSWHGGAPGGSLHVALAQGAILIEREKGSALEFADATSVANVGVPIDLRFAWLHLAGVAGYKRVWKVGVQTNRLSPAAISADVDYERDGAYSGQAILSSTFSWASPAPSYLEIRPEVQKLTAIRVRIYESTGITTNETVSIVGLVFEVAAKKGARRVAPEQVGT